ncbi:MAG: AMP phosphorylase [Candidatus Woesearchaeota archaeon]
MKLKVKDVNLSTGGPLIAVMNEEDAKNLDVRANDRIKIKRLRAKKEITAVVDVSSKGISPGEVGLFEELLKKLDVEEGVCIEAEFSGRPHSIMYIKKKMEGQQLSDKEITAIISDIVHNKLSEIELTYFVSGCYANGLTMSESVALTKAIVDTGDKLNFGKKIVIDKHCAGGVPNNRTTMVIVPILAALGHIMPKTSSRSITSPAGTADTMEVLCPVSLTLEKIKEVVKKTGACIVWGGAINLAAADDRLIRVRHPLSIDPEGMLLASILAKKKAVGSTHVIIDLPYGYGSKIPTKKQAACLGKKFVTLGKMLRMKIKVVLTDGSEPIGNGIGPALEAKDVLLVLQNDGPNDLREKSIFLATEILKMIGEKNAQKKVLDVLNSGKAYEKFIEIIKEQGGRKHIRLPKAKFVYDVFANASGEVVVINNKGLSKIARIAGAPDDKVAGIYLRVKKGFRVRKGQEIFTIHAKNKAKLDSAVSLLKEVETVKIK